MSSGSISRYYTFYAPTCEATLNLSQFVAIPRTAVPSRKWEADWKGHVAFGRLNSHACALSCLTNFPGDAALLSRFLMPP